MRSFLEGTSGPRVRPAPATGSPRAETDGDSPVDLDRLVVLAGELYAAAVTDQTRESYARRWREFSRWCERNDLTPLPASPEVLMLYLAHGADHGYSVATLRGRAAAINRVHLEAGEEPPGRGAALRLFWNGLARTLPTPGAIEITALRITGLREVCRSIDAAGRDPGELRDRAILGLFSAEVGRSEIANLEWADVGLTDVGMTLRLRHNYRTREMGVTGAVDDAAGPVMALAAWAGHARGEEGTLAGPVFWHLDPRCGRRQPLDGKTVWTVRVQRTKTLGVGGQPATLAEAMALLGDRHPIDLRDKAMLTLGFAGAMRRGELTGLKWSDLRLTQDGLICRIRRSKTDMEGRRQPKIGIPYGRSDLTCPVTAVMAWRARVEAQFGPVDPEGWVFTVAGRRGRAESLGRGPIKRDTLTRMVVARARQAGLDGHWGGRSLRAGFISTAADLDIPLEAIATQSRHKTLDRLAVYIRDVDPFRRNPAGRVGL